MIASRKRRLAAQRSRRQPQPVPGNLQEAPLPELDEWRNYLAISSASNDFNKGANPLRSVKAFYTNPAHSLNFPILRRLASKYLAAPASESSCEKTFSALKVVVGEHRHSLNPEVAEVQTLLKINASKLVKYGWL